jgi:hypothetical protein
MHLVAGSNAQLKKRWVVSHSGLGFLTPAQAYEQMAGAA